MKIAILRERRPHERRVAASPDTVKKFIALGFDVAVENGAGDGAAIPDAAFAEAGADVAADAATALADADIVLKVQRPLIAGDDDSDEGGADEGGAGEVGAMKRGAIVIGTLAALQHPDDVAAWRKAGLTAFSLELLPRITRAQSMDVLSSQSNLAGYKAVLDGAHEFGRAFPMMMTAAGTIPPARVLILGAGVAGLQAIATARRLGAVVSAYDVRPVVKEQVESLGAKFVEVDAAAIREAETEAGYAKEMGADYRNKQERVLADVLAKQDVAICTALIPGRPAPVLITEDMVKSMRPGSVIVDLAVEQGGNCPLSVYGEVVVRHGVTIVGHANVPSRLARDTTAMYARNLLNFLTPLVDAETKELAIDWDDEIIKACLITRDGKLVHPSLTDAPEEAAEAAS
jgi:NAD(P) transhydrogenase subunit alpha